MSADGQRFLVVSSVGEQYAPPRFIIVENWLEELRQGVPVK